MPEMAALNLDFILQYVNYTLQSAPTLITVVGVPVMWVTTYAVPNATSPWVVVLTKTSPTTTPPLTILQNQLYAPGQGLGTYLQACYQGKPVSGEALPQVYNKSANSRSLSQGVPFKLQVSFWSGDPSVSAQFTIPAGANSVTPIQLGSASCVVTSTVYAVSDGPFIIFLAVSVSTATTAARSCQVFESGDYHVTICRK